VLLLCGPPGLGKTTLAHIAAKHCGYCVLEVWALINASDDRSASMIESKILDVVQMNSVMPDSKPKCLIIDEIDGALGEGKGAVDVILKMVCIFLVICICNDVYAPALRALRQVAKVHMFMQPTVSRVVNRLFTHDRLKFICEREGLRTNRSALSALAEYTEKNIHHHSFSIDDEDVVKCLNLLGVSDSVIHYVLRTQQMSLHGQIALELQVSFDNCVIELMGCVILSQLTNLPLP
ncbi:hypothetical protein BHM03_00019561, partial [Ensete ventricosum]